MVTAQFAKQHKCFQYLSKVRGRSTTMSTRTTVLCPGLMLALSRTVRVCFGLCVSVCAWRTC